MAKRRRNQQGFSDNGARGSRASGADSAFRTHLAVFVVTGLFLFSLNLLTSPLDWWFYWPLFFWGWALAIHAVATYKAEAPSRIVEALRSLLPGELRSGSNTSGSVGRAGPEPPFAAASFAQVHERIEEIKRTAWQVPEGPVRDQVFNVATSAERIAGVMAADRADADSVDRFNSHYLEPAVGLLTRYARLSSRGVTGAEETLRRVEEENLPLLESRLEELYDRLHRGEIVELATTSEMLDFDVPEVPSAASNTRF